MGIITKLFKGQEKPKEKPNIIKTGDWEITVRDGAPYMVYKKGKEWLDSSKVWKSPDGKYFAHYGYDSQGDECIAITTVTEGLRIRKMDEGVADVYVTDDGVAYIMTDEANLYTLSGEKSGKRSLLIGDEDPEEKILTPLVVAVAYDDWENTATIKGVELATGKTWKKAIKYREPESYGEITLAFEQTNTGVKITTQDGTAHYISATGEIE